MVGALLSVLVVLSSEGARAQAIQLAEVGQIPGPVELVRVSGEFAYVVGGHTFTAYDLSDRSAPVARSSYVFPEEIWGFRLAGDRAYVGANFFGLGILDISNPDELRLISQHKTLGQTKIGDVAHGKVGIIDHMEGFVLVDFRSPLPHSKIWGIYVKISININIPIISTTYKQTNKMPLKCL